jgi:hypothetical protein
LIFGKGDVVRVDRSGKLGDTDYDGRMFLRCLLPTEAELNLRGGPGFEFWCDGVNRPMDGRSARYSTSDSPREGGQWRIEISPRTPALEDRFLNVMALGSQAGLKDPPEIVRMGSETSETVGLRIDGMQPLLFVPDKTGLQTIKLDADEVKSGSCLLFVAHREVLEVSSVQPDGSRSPVPFKAAPGWVEVELAGAAGRTVLVSFKPL